MVVHRENSATQVKGKLYKSICGAATTQLAENSIDRQSCNAYIVLELIMAFGNKLEYKASLLKGSPPQSSEKH